MEYTPEIVIINPPSPPEFQANRDFMGGFGATNVKNVTRVPPLMAEYVTGALKSKSFAADIIDLAVEESPEDVINSLSCVRIAGIYCGTATFKDDLKFADLVKERTRAFTFMFGPQVSVTPEYAMAHSSLDAVIMGEPEFCAIELALLVVSGSADFSGVKGLTWRRRNRDTLEVVRNEARCPEEELDRIPFPYRNLKYVGKYFYKPNENPFITALASRGCPYDCFYCPYPVSQGNRFRARSVRNVIDELLYEKKRFDYKMILFRDPVFTFDRSRTEELCKSLKQNIGVMWRCETACLNVDEKLLDIMRASGCVGINFGIETGSPLLISKYAKKTGGLDKIRKVFKHSKKIGIKTTAFFIVGLPGETKETMRETLKFAIELDPVEINFTTATPFPGTPLNKMLREKGLITGDEFEDYKVYECIADVENMTSEMIQGELTRMYMLFYLRPKRLLAELIYHPALFLKKSFLMLFFLFKRTQNKRCGAL